MSLLEIDFKLLFEMQSVLDARIKDEKHLDKKKDFFTEKILALLVELGEFSNEHQSFKFWKIKKEMKEDDLLEEYVDMLHFFLSISNDNGWSAYVVKDLENLYKPLHSDADEKQKEIDKNALNDQTIELFYSILACYLSKNKSDFVRAFYNYLLLGMLFGFTKDDVMDFYGEKNEENHRRIEANY